MLSDRFLEEKYQRYLEICRKQEIYEKDVLTFDDYRKKIEDIYILTTQ